MSIKEKCLCAVISACVAFCSCGSKNTSVNKNDTSKSATRDVFAMDTYMNLKAYGSNADIALTEAESRIHELENELSATSETSDIWKLDHHNGEPLEMCDDAVVLINKAKQIGEMTDGALDITLYPILKEWGFTTGEYNIPQSKTIDELLKNVDYKKISVNENTVTLPEKSLIDLGALAKGYTGDEIMEIFKSHDISSGIISLGGNVQALGKKPDGSEWKVAVRDPFLIDRDMCVVEISDKAVITSGNYERFFIGDDGNKYWHILDPKDGYPADNGLVSVTVIGKNGLECDSLSTALFVLGYNNTLDFLKKHPENDVILVTDDQKIFYTQGLKDSFTNISDMPAEVIAVD